MLMYTLFCTFALSSFLTNYVENKQSACRIELFYLPVLVCSLVKKNGKDRQSRAQLSVMSRLEGSIIHYIDIKCYCY